MTRGDPHPEGKFLFIGGGIANFTNVAATFKGIFWSVLTKGIIRALNEHQQRLQAHKVRIFVRRAGPNFQEGLRLMRNLGETLGVSIQVFGPEMHVTGIVPLALFGKYGDFDPSSAPASTNGNILMGQVNSVPSMDRTSSSGSSAAGLRKSEFSNFSMDTQAFIYGMQPKAVQGMLDFDFMCNRTKPSVACMIYPFGGHHVQKFYWGTTETLIPVYTSISEAIERFPNVDVVVNFASFRR